MEVDLTQEFLQFHSLCGFFLNFSLISRVFFSVIFCAFLRFSEKFSDFSLNVIAGKMIRLQKCSAGCIDTVQAAEIRL